jgi:hypothetical protein
MRFLLLALASAAFAQDPGILLQQTFETDTAGWNFMGQGGTLAAADGALVLTYEVKPKQLAAAMLPAPSSFARMQRLRFRARSGRDTAVGVLLAEKRPGGGNYTAWFWAPANVWQNVELAPADFSAADGPNDPVDADGKLDLDAVQGVAIFDLASFLGSVPLKGDFPAAIDRPSGPQTIRIADFQVLSSAGQAAVPIDRFERDWISWITLGGMKLNLRTKDNPLGERALEASYRQSATEIPVLLRRLAGMDLSQATRLSFDVASEREATLVVSLETKGGGRHSMQIFPPGGRELFHVSLKLADFEGEGTLEPAQLKSLLLTDITAAAGGAEAANTIWIGKVETAR